MTILEARETNENKITEMKMNSCYISYLTRNNFILYFFTKKRMVGINEDMDDNYTSIYHNRGVYIAYR